LGRLRQNIIPFSPPPWGGRVGPSIKMQALLSTTYFGPIQWYQKLCSYGSVMIERHESFMKQTYRNRCIIAATNGLQTLTVPVVREGTYIRDIRISDHANWRHQHWHALMSAYSESPFFEYYADDIRPFFERRWTYLYDFNMDICLKMCELLDIRPDIRHTEDYVKPAAVAMLNESDGTGGGSLVDFRDAINPKHPHHDPGFSPRRYYQVYERKHGFQPNLSILDLLFNMGPEGIFYIK